MAGGHSPVVCILSQSKIKLQLKPGQICSQLRQRPRFRQETGFDIETLWSGKELMVNLLELRALSVRLLFFGLVLLAGLPSLALAQLSLTGVGDSQEVPTETQSQPLSDPASEVAIEAKVVSELEPLSQGGQSQVVENSAPTSGLQTVSGLPLPAIKPASIEEAQKALDALLPKPPRPLVKPQSVAVVPKREDQLALLPDAARQQWERYATFRDVKAFAVSVSGLQGRPVVGFTVASRRVATAIDGALTACQTTAKQQKRAQDCEVFAIGDYIVYGAGPNYDRQVIAVMEGIKASGKVGRRLNGSIQK